MAVVSGVGHGAVLVRCVHGTYVCRAPFLCAWSSKGKLILNLKTNIQVVTNMFTKCNLKLLFSNDTSLIITKCLSKSGGRPSSSDTFTKELVQSSNLHLRSISSLVSGGRAANKKIHHRIGVVRYLKRQQLRNSIVYSIDRIEEPFSGYYGLGAIGWQAWMSGFTQVHQPHLMHTC
jgi:hypothetical protein